MDIDSSFQDFWLDIILKDISLSNAGRGIPFHIISVLWK